jgi:hypothetical protein
MLRHRSSLQLTTVMVIMVVLWDAIRMPLITAVTLLLLLLDILIASNGLVALLFNWRVLLAV